MPVEKRNAETDPVTGERKKTVRNDEDMKDKEVVSENKKKEEYEFIEHNGADIKNFVSVRSNNYVLGPLGGFRDLRLTVNNDSRYHLDAVTVELQIIKFNQQPLKTELITFRNVAPNGSLTVKIPDSQRGIRVEFRIKNVESSQWKKETAAN